MLSKMAFKRRVGFAVDQTDNEIRISEAFADPYGWGMLDRRLADRGGLAKTCEGCISRLDQLGQFGA